MPLAARIPRNLPSRQRMPRQGDSKAHLAFVRSLPCCVCGGPAEAHHLLRADGVKGMARKAPDRWCIPLCPEHHRVVHARGDDESQLADWGIPDARGVASGLWSNSGDHDAGERIVWRARNRGR